MPTTHNTHNTHTLTNSVCPPATPIPPLACTLRQKNTTRNAPSTGNKNIRVWWCNTPGTGGGGDTKPNVPRSPRLRAFRVLFTANGNVWRDNDCSFRAAINPNPPRANKREDINEAHKKHYLYHDTARAHKGQQTCVENLSRETGNPPLPWFGRGGGALMESPRRRSSVK